MQIRTRVMRLPSPSFERLPRNILRFTTLLSFRRRNYSTTKSQPMEKPQYLPVSEEDCSENSDSNFPRPTTHSYSVYLLIITTITTCLLATTTSLLAYKLYSLQRCPNTYETGFITDLSSVKKFTRTQEKVFTGGLKYDERDNLYRELEPGQPQYVGAPGPAIESAWDNLLQPLGMVLRDEEAETIKGKTFQEPDGSWLLTLDVYHSLHCVNMVRQALDTEYYQRFGEDPQIYRMHTDHCLDYLRQAIQCSSDLTPLTYEYSESRGRRYPIFGAIHTCRDFGTLHNWAMERVGNHSL